MKFVFIFFSIFLIGCGSVSPRFTSVVPKNKSVIIENEVKPKAPIKIENSAIPQEKMMDEVLKYLGTPYKLGGNSKEGIDCSAFTQTIFSQSIGNNLPRTTSEQFKIGKEINLEQIVFGDLLFFNTNGISPSHVGIYIGENLFAHASEGAGVTISSIESSYYKKKFIGARRITK